MAINDDFGTNIQESIDSDLQKDAVVVIVENFEKETVVTDEHANKQQEEDALEIPIDNEVDGVDDVEDELAKVAQKQSNTYAAKKTVAQGMMDIALITANANQLRYIVEFNQKSPTYYLTLILITISLLLQIAVGVALIFKGKMDLKGKSKHRNAKKINNHVVVGVFLVTIINVFIASFTITGNS